MSIKNIVESPHKIYSRYNEYWKFLLLSYEGGLDYTLADVPDSHVHGTMIRVNGKDYSLKNKYNLFEHKKERTEDFKRRIEMSYYYNFCAPIIDIYANHLLSDEPVVDLGNIENVFGLRIDDVDMMGSSMQEFRRNLSETVQIFGHTFVLTDKMNGNEEYSLAQRIDNNSFPYFKIIYPTDVLNWSLDKFGAIDWILFKECADNANDPDNYDPKQADEVFYKLWTKDEWRIYNSDYDLLDVGIHSLGRVPVDVFYDKKSKKHRNLLGVSTLSDIVFIARDVYNKCSELNEIIRNQTFSILAVQGKQSDYNESEVGTNIAIVYPEGTNAPQYVSPPSTNADVLMRHIDRQIKKIFQIAKLEGGDAEMSGDVQSGISKAYDFHNTNASLASKASNMEDGEIRLYKTFGAWEGVDWDGTVEYNRNFNVKDLLTDLDEAERMLRMNIGQEIDAKIKTAIVKKKFPRMEEQDIEEKVKQQSQGQRLRDRMPNLFTPPSGENGGGLFNGRSTTN